MPLHPLARQIGLHVVHALPTILGIVVLNFLLLQLVPDDAATAIAAESGAASAEMLAFYSVPAFWVSLMLPVVISVKLGWVPAGGAGPAWSDKTGMARLLEQAHYLLLPATYLAAP